MKKSISQKQGVAARVLLVDDNRDGLKARRALLEEQGFEIATALNGEEGLEALSTAEFDLLITDFKMPKMNGLELIRRVKPLQPKLLIILLSGFVEALGLDERSTGADMVIAKGNHEIPYLLRAVARLLARNVTRRPAASQRETRPKAKSKTKSV